MGDGQAVSRSISKHRAVLTAKGTATSRNDEDSDKDAAGPSKPASSRSVRNEIKKEFERLTQRTDFSDDERSPLKKKKYYIVADGERPSELYRTDLLHRMKQEEEDDSSDDEVMLVRMTDRWREEWNRGVQVPLYKKLPNFVVEDSPSTSDVASRSTSIIINNNNPLTAVHDRRYVKSKHKRSKMPPLRHYHADDLDRNYLNVLNNERVQAGLTQISEECFGNVLDKLEVECYQMIHHDLMAPIASSATPLDTEFDEDTCCDICRQPDFEDDDKIIFCDGCNLSVHQSCYGLDSVPPNEWICKKCLVLGFNAVPQCILCPLTGGAMKSTREMDLWAHVVCALWVPEVRFTDVDHREPIANLCNVPNERWMLTCSVCDTKQGVCIQCTVDTCAVAFHVSCAQRMGLILRIEHGKSLTEGVRMVSLCQNHSRTARIVEEAKNYNANVQIANIRTLEEMESFFFLYVSPHEISQKLNVCEDIVNDVYEYWKMRRADQNNRPMISDVSDLEIDAVKRVQSSPSTIRSTRCRGETRIRQNLEKVRNLCYMIGRREKLKQSLHTCWRETYQCVYNMLKENRVPHNERTLERFISALENRITSETVAEPLDEPTEELTDSVSVKKMFKSTVSQIRERNGPNHNRNELQQRDAGLSRSSKSKQAKTSVVQYNLRR